MQISRLAAHFDPILAVFAPLWWIWPSPEMLLVVQAVAVALGALPVFWLARKHLAGDRAGLAFALVYLLYPATEWLTLNEFHPVALACPLLLFAFWYLDEDRLLLFAVFAALAMTTKEEIGLVVAGLGIWYAVRRRARVGDDRSPGPGCSSRRSRSPSSSRTTTPARTRRSTDATTRSAARRVGSSRRRSPIPGRCSSRPSSTATCTTCCTCSCPSSFLFVALAARARRLRCPKLALNQLSATPTQTSIHFHYTAAAIAPLIAATVLGAAALARRFPARAGVVVAVAVAVAVGANWKLGAVPLWTARARAARTSRRTTGT